MPTTLDDILALPNGAIFRRADLHVHSFGGSDDVQDTSMTVEGIADAAIQQGISVVAITDHNNDANIARALQYARNYEGELLLLPGVEITTANGHVLAYFAPDQASAVRDLLGRIEIVGKLGGRDSHTKKSMADVILEVDKLKGVCIAAHIDRPKTGFEAIVPGYPNWKKDVICSRALCGIEVDDPSHLSWYSLEDELTPSGTERKKLIAAREGSAETAGRMHLAHVQNSDAHRLVDFVNQSSGRALTRYKMDEMTFEAFRTALRDPEARVRASASIPPAFPRILGVSHVGGFLDDEHFHFSDNLNCFIGGRGAGKSTAVRSLAYGIGARDEFEEHGNCPDTVTIYCEDANGVRYTYERSRGLGIIAYATEDGSTKEVPLDAFRIEFYGQGEISEVAKDPLGNASLLQEFLDRHILLTDLTGRETDLCEELSQNSAQLIPLEASAAQFSPKNQKLAALHKQLEAAEKGKVKEVASFQVRLAAEQAFCNALSDVSDLYESGLSYSSFARDYDALKDSAGELTGAKTVEPFLERCRASIDSANALFIENEKAINQDLKKKARAVREALKSIQALHTEFEKRIAEKLNELRAQGLSGSVDQLNVLIGQRKKLSAEVIKISNQRAQLIETRKKRAALFADLKSTRDAILERRKAQLRTINDNLQKTIKDYSINLYYDDAGITEEFRKVVLETMHGSFFQEETAELLCVATTPQELALWVLEKNLNQLAAVGLDPEWNQEIVTRFQTLAQLHRLQTTWKPPRPVIKVLTKTSPQKLIPVSQLSDGQKHTILLTIAMLAESNLPLVIDQPEDDLDNEFISTAVVSTLRSIKERRQVILVTHNANIAVLGDSELIFPLRRVGEKGHASDCGSIDKSETMEAVQQILEGGELAFKKRMNIYGY
jgi:hypothetical protein